MSSHPSTSRRRTLIKQDRDGNERAKRHYRVYLTQAKGLADVTIEHQLRAVNRFEELTGFADFKTFGAEMAVDFKKKLMALPAWRHGEKSARPLAHSSIVPILNSVKVFLQWLSGQPGYRSRIGNADICYLTFNLKDQRAALSHGRDKSFPTLAQCRHAFNGMPSDTVVHQRNRALFALLMLTGARIDAAITLRLKHVDVRAKFIIQDAREVRTKASKTITTYFFPIDGIYLDEVRQWVDFLTEEFKRGREDPFFPRRIVGNVEGWFQATGLSQDVYTTPTVATKIIAGAFEAAGLPRFGPHSFRRTIVGWVVTQTKSPTKLKAASQNLGHSDLSTTIGSYLHVSEEEQARLIAKLGKTGKKSKA